MLCLCREVMFVVVRGETRFLGVFATPTNFYDICDIFGQKYIILKIVGSVGPGCVRFVGENLVRF